MLKTYLLPQGRMSRAQFWRAVAIVGIAFQLLQLALVILLAGVVRIDLAVFYVALAVPTALAAYVAAVVGIRRLHDRDRSAWWMLLALVPVGGGFWYLFANGTMPGTKGPNRFGFPPGATAGAVARVFADGGDEDRSADSGPAGRAPQRRPSSILTVLLWLILVAVTGVTVLLFQNPNPQAWHAATASGTPAAP